MPAAVVCITARESKHAVLCASQRTMNSESPLVDMSLGMAEEAFQADCQEYALKGTYKLVIVLRWAKFSQAEFLVLLVN